MTENTVHHDEIDRGTFEILFQIHNKPTVVGWIRSDGPWDAAHGEDWALKSTFSAPGPGNPDVALTFRFLDPSGDLAAFKSWLQANNHTYQDYMKHAVTT